MISRKGNQMADRTMNYKRYPTDEKARSTFTNDEFAEALADYIKSKPVQIIFQFNSYNGVVLQPNSLIALANLCSTLPNCKMASDLNIVRGKTETEIESDVLGVRKADMFYHSNSPHYMGDDYVYGNDSK